MFKHKLLAVGLALALVAAAQETKAMSATDGMGGGATPKSYLMGDISTSPLDVDDLIGVPRDWPTFFDMEVFVITKEDPQPEDEDDPEDDPTVDPGPDPDDPEPDDPDCC